MKTLKCTYTDIKTAIYFSYWDLNTPIVQQKENFSLNHTHIHSKNFKRKNS